MKNQKTEKSNIQKGSSWWRLAFMRRQTRTKFYSEAHDAANTENVSKRAAFGLIRLSRRHTNRNKESKAGILEVDTGSSDRFSLRRSLKKCFTHYTSKSKQSHNDVDSFVAKLTMELIDDFSHFEGEDRSSHIVSRAKETGDMKGLVTSTIRDELQQKSSYVYLPSQKIESCIDSELESCSAASSRYSSASFVNNSDYENFDAYDTNTGTVFSAASSKSTIPTGNDIYKHSPETIHKHGDISKTIYLPRLRPSAPPTEKASEPQFFGEKARVYPGALPIIPHSY